MQNSRCVCVYVCVCICVYVCVCMCVCVCACVFVGWARGAHARPTKCTHSTYTHSCKCRTAPQELVEQAHDLEALRLRVDKLETAGGAAAAAAAVAPAVGVAGAAAATTAAPAAAAPAAAAAADPAPEHFVTTAEMQEVLVSGPWGLGMDRREWVSNSGTRARPVPSGNACGFAHVQLHARVCRGPPLPHSSPEAQPHPITHAPNPPPTLSHPYPPTLSGHDRHQTGATGQVPQGRHSHRGRTDGGPAGVRVRVRVCLLRHVIAQQFASVSPEFPNPNLPTTTPAGGGSRRRPYDGGD